MLSFVLSAGLNPRTGTGSTTERSSLLVDREEHPSRAFPHRRWPLHTSARGEGLHQSWDLRVFGEVHDELRVTFGDLNELPSAEALMDTGLVARPRRRARRWYGIDTAGLLDLAGIQPTAKWLVVHSEGGYSQTLNLNRVLKGPAVLAQEVDGAPLTGSEGGPVRLVLPHLQARHSAKWVRGLELKSSF